MKFIETLREGERINEIYLCKFKQAALTKSGKPYDNVISYAVIISVSLFFSVILAKLVGGMLPLAAKKRGTDFPHLLVIDLGSEQTVNALDYLPRAEQGAPGSIKQLRVFVY